MTVREYLNRPEKLKHEILRQRARAETLRRLSVRYAAPPQEVRVRTSPDPTRTQEFLAEVADTEQEILRLEEEQNQAKADTALFISRLPDERLIRLLDLRYLEGLRWEETAAYLGYSISRTYYLHQLALSLLPPPPAVPGEYPR